MSRRKPKGELLTERILAHLRAHPGQQFTAKVIGAAVGANSHSVAMGCFRLFAHGRILSRPGHLRLYSVRRVRGAK